MSPLLLLATGAVVYFGYIKPKQDAKKKSSSSSNGGTGKPRILFDEQCSWIIPDAWWTDVGSPKFTAIVQGAVATAQSWDQKLELLGTLNSHAVAHQILTGETPATCPLPPVTTNVANPPAGLTKAQETMIYLFADMINHVEASLKAFAASAGTKIQFPVPMPEP